MSLHVNLIYSTFETPFYPNELMKDSMFADDRGREQKLPSQPFHRLLYSTDGWKVVELNASDRLIDFWSDIDQTFDFLLLCISHEFCYCQCY